GFIPVPLSITRSITGEIGAATGRGIPRDGCRNRRGRSHSIGAFAKSPAFCPILCCRQRRTEGFWFSRKLDQKRIAPWVFDHRRNLWAVSMVVYQVPKKRRLKQGNLDPAKEKGVDILRGFYIFASCYRRTGPRPPAMEHCFLGLMPHCSPERRLAPSC